MSPAKFERRTGAVAPKEAITAACGSDSGRICSLTSSGLVIRTLILMSCTCQPRSAKVACSRGM